MRRRALRASVAVGLGALCALAWTPAAQAAFPATVFDDAPSPLTCNVQAANGNVRLCSGEVPSFDGTSIDVNVILPPVGTGTAPYPAIGTYHGWGGSKIGINTRTQNWATNGYAVFSMTDRGWAGSCGGTDPDRLDQSKCAKGYNHLMDDRYEVRDAQFLIGRLVDDGAVDPNKIGANGGSYGGGMSMALAALKDRTMMPDGSLVPWTSPKNHTPMSLAVATPEIPWTDLPNSLMPNGHTLDYVADAPYLKRGRIGVMKQTFTTGLFALGAATGYYSTPGTDPSADLTTWFALINAGEPYDQNPQAQSIVSELTTFHSSYYIDHSQAPAPLLISNGWTDDLFPPDEAIRFYNRTRTDYPAAKIGLQFMDFGHQRGQNKSADTAALAAREDAWFDFYLKGIGGQPATNVQALTTTCPKAAPSTGPYSAATWAQLPAGEIDLAGAAAQTIVPGSGDVSRNSQYDPISAGNDPCKTAPGSNQPGVASYNLPASTSGFTVLGSPTIVADINNSGPFSEIAARLLDVDAGGNATLIARGTYRPEINPGLAPTKQVFQLHPDAYPVAPGHTLKLELLPSDQPYARPSNAQAPITVSNLELRIPTLEGPGSLGGGVTVNAVKTPVVPSGYRLAADFLTGPPGDQDGDGVGDATDNCPAAPGPASNNGCPTIGADADKDGIPDSQDLCPTIAGVVSNGGCPAGAAQGQNPASAPAPGATKAKCKKKKAKRHHRASAAKKKHKKHCGKKKKRKRHH